MKQKNLGALTSILLFTIILIISSSVQGQVKKFRNHQVIEVGGGVKVEILTCRGEGANEECDVIYYTDRRQTGKRLWQPADKIREEEKAAKKARTDSIRESILKVVRKSNPTTKTKDQLKKPLPHKEAKVQRSVPPITKNTSLPTKQKGTYKKDDLTGKTRKATTSQQEKDEKSLVDTLTAQTPANNAIKTDSNRLMSNSQVPTTISSLGREKQQDKKLSVFVDCNTGCDMNYLRSELAIVDFLLDRIAADVHLMINEQQTGSGGSSIQLIYYGQNKYRGVRDTLSVDIRPNSTDFERRAEMLKGIKFGLIPFLLKTPSAKYLDVKIQAPEQETLNSLRGSKDPWNYWVFRIGADGTFNSDQVYKIIQASTFVSANRTTDKLKISFTGNGNYSNYSYTYIDNGTSLEYKFLNSDYFVEHTLIASLRSHWGVGYQMGYSNNTYSNNKSRIYLKTAVEYSIFPYKDVNTRFFTISYGLDVRANNYYDTTIYFLTEEVLVGQMAQAIMSFNQKWGTFSSTITYSNYFKDPALNNLAARLNFNIRITGGLSFNIYTSGSRVRDQVYLVKGSATEQDVLTRRRQLASEYNFYSGVGLNFRFGSKLNNFVNPRIGYF